MFVANIEKILYQEKNTTDFNYENSIIKLRLFRKRKLLLDGEEYYTTYTSVYNMLVTLGLANTETSTFNIFDYRGGFLRNEGSKIFNNITSTSRLTNPNPGSIGGDIFNSNVTYVANIRNPDHTHTFQLNNGIGIQETHYHTFGGVTAATSPVAAGQNPEEPILDGTFGTQDLGTATTGPSNTFLTLIPPSTIDFVSSNTIPGSLQAETIVSSYYIPSSNQPPATGSDYSEYDPLIGSCSANDLAPSSITVFYAMDF